MERYEVLWSVMVGDEDTSPAQAARIATGLIDDGLRDPIEGTSVLIVRDLYSGEKFVFDEWGKRVWNRHTATYEDTDW
jgi:hypothetical protein